MPNTFPFYDAEPYWPKRNSGSGGGSGSGGSIGETLPYHYLVSMTDTAFFFLSTSPFTDVSGKTPEQLVDMSISSVTASNNNDTSRSIEVHVSDGMYFCCLLKTKSSVNTCKIVSGGYLDDHEWGSYQIGDDSFVYVTGSTNADADVPDDSEIIMISDMGVS